MKTLVVVEETHDYEAPNPIAYFATVDDADSCIAYLKEKDLESGREIVEDAKKEGIEYAELWTPERFVGNYRVVIETICDSYQEWLKTREQIINDIST